MQPSTRALGVLVLSSIGSLTLALDGCSSSSSPSGTATPQDAGTGTAKAATKRVFLTSKSFTGDLSTLGKASDGLAGGDALCNAAAKAAKLTGTWVAWLSTASTKASSRVDMTAIRVAVDGTTKVFDPADSSGLTAIAAFDMDESGNTVDTSLDATTGLDGTAAWSATDGLGSYETGTPGNGLTDDACKSWTSASSTLAATVGDPSAAATGDSSWTDGTGSSSASCNSAQHLYCFEK